MIWKALKHTLMTGSEPARLAPVFTSTSTPPASGAFSRLLTLAALTTLSILTVQSVHPAEWRENNEFSFKVLGVGTSRLQETRFDLRKGEHRLTVGAQYAKYRATQTLASPFSDAAHDYDAGLNALDALEHGLSWGR